MLCKFYAASEKPTAKELSVYIKPYAQQWFEIGLLLGIQLQKLESIEEHHKNDVQSCGARMLMEWLVSDPNACWKKLREAVENVSNLKVSAVSGTKILYSWKILRTPISRISRIFVNLKIYILEIFSNTSS